MQICKTNAAAVDTPARDDAGGMGWSVMPRLGRFVLVAPDGAFAENHRTEQAVWKSVNQLSA